MPFVIFKNISLVYGLSENLTDAIDCLSRKKKKKGLHPCLYYYLKVNRGYIKNPCFKPFKR